MHATRAGAFILSFTTMLVSAAMTGLPGFLIARDVGTASGSLHTAFIITGAVFATVSFVALSGFLGTTSKSGLFATIYSSALFLLLAPALGSGVFLIVCLFMNGSAEFLDACLEIGQGFQVAVGDAADAFTDDDANIDISPSSREFCPKKLVIFKGAFIGLLVAAAITQALCACVVRAHANRLADHELRRVEKEYHDASPSPQPDLVINDSCQQGTEEIHDVSAAANRSTVSSGPPPYDRV